MQLGSFQVMAAELQPSFLPIRYFYDRSPYRYAACVAAMLPDVRHNQCAEQFLQLQRCVRNTLRKR